MSLRLESITLREIRIPLRNPIPFAQTPSVDRRVLLLTLHDVDGVRAWTECLVGDRPTMSPETVDTAWLAIHNWIGPRVLSQSLVHPNSVDNILHRSIRGHLRAKAAVEMGLWALWAERETTSLSRLLGGTRTTVPAGISIEVQDKPDMLVNKVREALVLGYQKITVCIRPGADVQFVGEIRNVLGMSVPLAVDCRGTYTVELIDALQDVAAFRPLLMEQPFPPANLLRHSKLQDIIEPPLSLHDSITQVVDVEEMVTLGAARVANIQASRVGGFTRAKAIHDFCQHNNVDAYCGGEINTGIGRAYDIALASLPHFSTPSTISASSQHWNEDIVAPTWSMDAAGWLPVPTERSGLGVSINEDRIDNLTVREKTLRAPGS